ncbi:MAG: TldD/PmbA family protein [Nitrososphaerota archaeon]
MVEDLLRSALDEAGKLGVEYAEARYQKDIEEAIILKNGSPEITARSVDEGIGIRVLVNGALGFSSTPFLTRSAVRKAVKSAFSMAMAASRLMKNGIKLSAEETARAKIEVKPRIGFEAVDLDAKIEFLREIDSAILKAAEKHGLKATRFLRVGRLDLEKRVVNSDGADVLTKIPRTYLEYFITLYSPQRGSIQRFQHLGEARGWEAVEAWRPADSFPDEVERVAAVLLRGTAPPRDSVDVVLGPEIVGIICHESAGHPGEADRVLGRELAQGGDSYIKPELLGTRIGSDVVTVVDDPTIPRSFGYSPYDDEGVKGRERRLIENGILKELLHNRETAAVFGVRSNGAARSAGYDLEPIIRMSTTYMKPGDHSFEELIEDIRDGVYIRSYQEWNIDDKRWNQRYVGVEAYRIVDGELREPVRNPVLEMTTRSLYSSIDAVGKDLAFFAGYCGKGDPMQGIPVWMGGPHIRLRRVRLEAAPSPAD